MEGQIAENCNLELALPVTKAVELVHHQLEIINAAFTPISSDHGVQRVILGICESYTKAFNAEELSNFS